MPRTRHIPPAKESMTPRPVERKPRLAARAFGRPILAPIPGSHQPASPLPPSSPPAPSSDVSFRLDAAPILPASVRGRTHPEPSDNATPEKDRFGFFEAERKLKAKRAPPPAHARAGTPLSVGMGRPGRETSAARDLSPEAPTELSYLDEEVPFPVLAPGAASPFAAAPDLILSLEIPSSLAAHHSTPKRRGKKRKSAGSPVASGADTPGSSAPSSMPSTPSPSRIAPRVSPRVTPRAFPPNHAYVLIPPRTKIKLVATQVEPEIGLGGGRSRKERAPAKKAKVMDAREDSGDGADLPAVSSTPVIAKRPLRRSARGTAGAAPAKRGAGRAVRKVNNENDSAPYGEEGGKQRRAPRGKKVGKGKAKAQPTAGDSESFVVDDEQREKYAQERQARQDYFRKLDNYKITEEYVL